MSPPRPVRARRSVWVPRWQDPPLDEAALDVARLVRGGVTALRGQGAERWAAYFEPLLSTFEDGAPDELLPACRRARAAFGPRDTVLDAWPTDDALRLRDSLDRLQRLIDRRLAVRP